MTAEQVWTAALGELRLQMTKATFDTWVASTWGLEWREGCLVVGVANEFAREWLENRLRTTVERTLTGIVGQPVAVEFLVTEAATSPARSGTKKQIKIVPAPAPGTVAVKFYEFDPMERGFLMMPRYCEWFWQPYLGCVTYATYRFLRTLDKQNEGWGSWRFVSVERIAATVARGRRQAITGVKRRTPKGREYWQKGAFDGLSEAGVARIETLGSGRNISYRVSCLNRLPLLVPEQVETLPEVLQVEHAAFLRRASIEYEEWEQLTLPTLVRE